MNSRSDHAGPDKALLGGSGADPTTPALGCQGSELGDLSVVIPVFNEEESLPHLVEKLAPVLDSLKLRSEVVFVDDGSSDSSLTILRKLKAQGRANLRILSLAARSGQSAACWAGFGAARGKIIATLDADLQNDPADLPLLIARLDQFDMVVGWRKRRQDPWLRKISTKISNGFRRFVLKDGFHDTGSSLRVLRRECLQELFPFNGMHRFLPTLVKQKGYRVGEVEVRHHERRFGVAKYGVRNRLFKALFDLFGVLWMRSRTIHYQIRSEE